MQTRTRDQTKKKAVKIIDDTDRIRNRRRITKIRSSYFSNTLGSLINVDSLFSAGIVLFDNL